MLQGNNRQQALTSDSLSAAKSLPPLAHYSETEVIADIEGGPDDLPEAEMESSDDDSVMLNMLEAYSAVTPTRGIFISL
jgi:hypothetical protein